MNRQDASAEFVKVAHRAWQRGLIAGTGGNMSLRCDDGILITPSGRANVDCGPDDLLLIDPEGGVSSGRGLPSKDMNFHLAIYATRPDVGGVLHAHVPWATSLTVVGYGELPAITPHATDKMGPVRVLPYAPSGSDELRDRVSEVFATSSASVVLLERHGLVAVGRTLTAAGEVAELAEETAQIALTVHTILGRPYAL